MTKVVIDMSMSLDGFVAGPNDSKADSGSANTEVCTSSTGTPRARRRPACYSLFRPAPGANREEVERTFAESGAYVFGRRTYDITDGWGGRHPVNGVPVFVLTHDPPADFPRGPSNLTFVTDGIESAIDLARAVAGGKDVKLGGASPGKQALAAGLCDEIFVHLAPYLLGGGVRLFDRLPDGIQLEKLSVSDGPFATHLRYRVVRES